MGQTSAVYGDWLLVGAPGTNDDNGTAILYHFDNTNDQFVFYQQFNGSEDALPNANGRISFGWTVAISANLLVISSDEDNTQASSRGALYVYSLTTPGGVDTWTFTSKIMAADILSASFTTSVACTDTFIITGCASYASYAMLDSAGPGTGWPASVSEFSTMNPGVTRPMSYPSVAIEGDILVVGNRLGHKPSSTVNADGSGVVYVYDMSVTDWITQGPVQTVYPPSPQENAYFGRVVALDMSSGEYGDVATNTGRMAVSEYQYDIDGNSNDDAGRVHIYTRDASGLWALEASLEPEKDSRYSYYGSSAYLSNSMSIYGNRIVFGYYKFVRYITSYTYVTGGTGWTQDTTRLWQQKDGESSGLGWSVSKHIDTNDNDKLSFIVGSPYSDIEMEDGSDLENSGAVIRFELISIGVNNMVLYNITGVPACTEGLKAEFTLVDLNNNNATIIAPAANFLRRMIMGVYTSEHNYTVDPQSGLITAYYTARDQWDTVEEAYYFRIAIDGAIIFVYPANITYTAPLLMPYDGDEESDTLASFDRDRGIKLEMYSMCDSEMGSDDQPINASVSAVSATNSYVLFESDAVSFEGDAVRINDYNNTFIADFYTITVDFGAIGLFEETIMMCEAEFKGDNDVNYCLLSNYTLTDVPAHYCQPYTTTINMVSNVTGQVITDDLTTSIQTFGLDTHDSSSPERTPSFNASSYTYSVSGVIASDETDSVYTIEVGNDKVVYEWIEFTTGIDPETSTIEYQAITASVVMDPRSYCNATYIPGLSVPFVITDTNNGSVIDTVTATENVTASFYSIPAAAYGEGSFTATAEVAGAELSVSFVVRSCDMTVSYDNTVYCLSTSLSTITVPKQAKMNKSFTVKANLKDMDGVAVSAIPGSLVTLAGSGISTQAMEIASGSTTYKTKLKYKSKGSKKFTLSIDGESFLTSPSFTVKGFITSIFLTAAAVTVGGTAATVGGLVLTGKMTMSQIVTKVTGKAAAKSVESAAESATQAQDSRVDGDVDLEAPEAPEAPQDVDAEIDAVVAEE